MSDVKPSSAKGENKTVDGKPPLRADDMMTPKEKSSKNVASAKSSTATSGVITTSGASISGLNSTTGSAGVSSPGIPPGTLILAKAEDAQEDF